MQRGGVTEAGDSLLAHPCCKHARMHQLAGQLSCHAAMMVSPRRHMDPLAEELKAGTISAHCWARTHGWPDAWMGRIVQPHIATPMRSFIGSDGQTRLTESRGEPALP